MMIGGVEKAIRNTLLASSRMAGTKVIPALEQTYCKLIDPSVVDGDVRKLLDEDLKLVTALFDSMVGNRQQSGIDDIPFNFLFDSVVEKRSKILKAVQIALQHATYATYGYKTSAPEVAERYAKYVLPLMKQVPYLLRSLADVFQD